MRPAFEPPSSERTVPMFISWMREGERLGWAAMVALSTWMEDGVG